MPEAKKSRSPADPSRGDPAEMMERMKRLTAALISVPREEVQRKMAESKAKGRRRGKAPAKTDLDGKRQSEGG